jgi:hypothetical protein
MVTEPQTIDYILDLIVTTKNKNKKNYLGNRKSSSGLVALSNNTPFSISKRTHARITPVEILTLMNSMHRYHDTRQPPPRRAATRRFIYYYLLG